MEKAPFSETPLAASVAGRRSSDRCDSTVHVGQRAVATLTGGLNSPV
jgi:hypothetical protein